MAVRSWKEKEGEGECKNQICCCRHHRKFGRGYLRQIGRIHRSHAIGGANDSAMVVMFVNCCVSGGWYFLYYSYRRNPMGREFFIPAGTL
jgi:hypothetical protein